MKDEPKTTDTTSNSTEPELSASDDSALFGDPFGTTEQDGEVVYNAWLLVDLCKKRQQQLTETRNRVERLVRVIEDRSRRIAAVENANVWQRIKWLFAGVSFS